MCFFWFSFLDELGHAFLHTWKILECTTKGDSMLPTTFYQNQINPLKRTGSKLCSSSSRSTAGNSLRTRASFMATLDHHIGISWSFVDGRNPAPVLVGSLSQFLPPSGFCTSQVVSLISEPSRVLPAGFLGEQCILNHPKKILPTTNPTKKLWECHQLRSWSQGHGRRTKRKQRLSRGLCPKHL